jgi:hypothetical protein
MKLKLIKNILVCCAAWLALGVSAQPPSDASLEELLKITRAESMLDDTKAGAEQIMRLMRTAARYESATRKKLTPVQQDMLNQYAVKAAALIGEEINWSKMKPQMLQLYRDTYTQEEMDGMLAFYRSPVGQSMIEKMPGIAKKSMEISQNQLRELMPKFLDALKEARAEAEAADK